MTLNITLLTPIAIYQSADFRLTDPSDASFIRDESAKTVVLRYMSWSGFVTYTGIGSWNGVSLSEMVVDWLTGIHAPSMADVVAIIEREGTGLIKELERRNPAYFYVSWFRRQFSPSVCDFQFRGLLWQNTANR